MEKYVSPIIYAFSIFLIFFGMIFVLSFLERFFNADPTGIVTVPMFSIIIGTSVFWFANILMREIENLEKPNIIDHFRQCSIFYVALIFIGYKLILLFKEYRGCVMYGELACIFILSIYAIIINGIFLKFYKRKK